MGIFSREHDRLSVLPYLHMNRFGETDPTFGISVQNDGVGPAVIEKVQIWYNNRILTSLPELYRQLLSNIPKMTNGRLTYTEVILGEYYRTGQTVHLMEGNGVDSEIQKAIWDQISSKLEIKINYCSTYKDCSVECLIASKIDCEKLSFNLPGLRLP